MSAQTGHDESCWTDEYLIAHSEGYRVDDERRQLVGVVDSVVWPDEPFEDAEAVVVRCAGRPEHIVIPVEEIREVDPWDKRIVVSARSVLPVSPASPPPLSSTHPVG
ncbi:MAG TPA: hypothetical protein VFX21_04440 [Acidimicrobiia bacterium]|jgi:hypothetical protein|nr:hypothetical protein [Acidimicrobiia bacterium]